jgi:PD-(D/E)XK endonuclease
MDTTAQGNAAEAAVLHALTRAGFPVLLPFGGGLAFDLAVVLPNGRIARVQVKSGRVKKACVEFNSASTDHGHGQRHYRGRADLIAVSVSALNQVFVVPVEECPTSRGVLRLEATRNNQHRRVRRGEDYTVEAWAAAVRHDGAAPDAVRVATAG